MSVERALSVARDQGADPERIRIGREVDVVPEAPSHVWVIFPSAGGAVVVGGMDRGAFTAYARFDDAEVAGRAVAQLLARRPPPPLPRDLAVARRAAAKVAADLDAAEGAAGGALVMPVGTPLDHIGSDSGHWLYLLGTPFGQRSLPPTDLTHDRTGYLLEGRPPSGCGVQRLPAWFGQPGGGWALRLDRPIAYYLDHGLLRSFEITDDPVDVRAGR